MMAHLNEATLMTLGELQVEAKAPPFLRLAPVRYLLIHVLPMPKGAPTAPELLARSSSADLATEQAAFAQLLDRLGQADHAGGGAPGLRADDPQGLGGAGPPAHRPPPASVRRCDDAMRLAALYDIHGNLPALEAVLDEVRRAGVDAVVVGGDVLPGPMPRETIDCLAALDLPVHYLTGNGDRVVLTERRGGDIGREVPEAFRDVIRWSAATLSRRRRDADRRLAGDRAAQVPAWATCSSVMPRRATTSRSSRASPPKNGCSRSSSGVESAVVVCGHTHMPFDRTVRGIRVVNAGSVGMPFGDPGADWLLLGPEVSPRHTRYDLEAAAARVRASAYPQAEAFAAGHVLRPPSELDMLKVFAQAELK